MADVVMLCFATFTRTLQATFTQEASDEKITKLLLEYVIDVADVQNRNGEQYVIDAKIANKLLNRRANLHAGIRKASANPDVIGGAAEFFEDCVVDYINESQRLDLLNNMRKLIEADGTIAEEKKAELLKQADDQHLPQFLAKVYIYALGKPNKLSPDDRAGANDYTQLVAANTTLNTGLPSDEALEKIVGAVMSALFASEQSEAVSFRNFKDAQFGVAVQNLIASGKMTYYEFYKCKNFIEIAEKADEVLREEDADVCDPTAFDFDWFLRFFEAAGGISNEDMQNLWAKVLAGEIRQQGSFSLRTIETLRNMTAREARVFQRAGRLVLSETDGSQFIFCDDSVGDYEINERHGLSTQDLFLLEECGLVNAFCITNTMKLDDGAGGFLSDSGIMLLIESSGNPDAVFHYKSYPISRAAAQLLPIVEEEPYYDYLIELGKSLREDNREDFRISLHEITGVVHGDEIELDLENDLLDE